MLNVLALCNFSTKNMKKSELREKINSVCTPANQLVEYTRFCELLMCPLIYTAHDLYLHQIFWKVHVICIIIRRFLSPLLSPNNNMV